MRSLLYLGTAAIVAIPLAVSQSLSDLQALPQCAQTPAETAFASTGCGLNQPACVCKNADFQTSLTNEVMKDCSQTDQLAVLKFSTDFCAKAGITVNVPESTAVAAQSPPTPAPAPASSAAPPPPPPPPSSSSPPPPPSSSAASLPSSSVATAASSTLVSSIATPIVSSTSSKYWINHAKTTLSSFVVPSASTGMTKKHISLKSTATGQALHPYPVASSSVVAYNGSNSSAYGGTILSFTGAGSTNSAIFATGFSIIASVLAAFLL